MAVWLRDLPAALAGWGFDVTTEPGWQTRGNGPLLRGPRGVVNHWTATPFRAADQYPTTRVLRDGRPGLPGPLCQLQLGFAGGVKIIAAGLANHAGVGSWPGVTGNSDLIGIECEGDGTFTSAQLYTYPRLNAALAAHYAGISVDRCFGHAEWAPRRKVDIHTWPGGMPAFRATVRTHRRGDDDVLKDQKIINPVSGKEETLDVTVAYLEQRIVDSVIAALPKLVAEAVWAAQVDNPVAGVRERADVAVGYVEARVTGKPTKPIQK